MIIGFDVTWMEPDNKFGGTFQYALRLISAIVEHTDATVVAIISKSGKDIFQHLTMHSNFRDILIDPPFSLRDIVEREHINLIHTPIQYFPNMTLAVPMITTLHDLQHFYYPEFFTTAEIAFRNMFYKYSAEFSERVIVSFPHVKEDIVKFYGIPAHKIDVCPLGSIKPQFVDNSKFNTIRKKYDIPSEYLFYSANTYRHKNHINLIRALKILHERYGRRIPLVCTGHKIADTYSEIESELAHLGLRKFVFFTGYIPEDEVHLLLRNATLVVIPTLYEAGSFPLMEAMAYDVPVICSNVTSLPDTIGDIRFVFDPNDIEMIAEKAVKMLGDEKLMEQNRANSREKLGQGGWNKVVHTFVNSYYRAIEDFKQKDADSLRSKMKYYEVISHKFNESLSNRYNSLLNTIDAYTSSTSWKITAPVRVLKAFLGRTLKRFASLSKTS